MRFFSLVGLLISMLLAGCEMSPTAKVQSEINDLLEKSDDKITITTSEAEWPGKWSMIEAETSYDCFGDVCYKTVYGLVNRETGDTLRPAFNSIRIFGLRVLLEHDDWTALTDDQLHVERTLTRTVFANDSLLLVWDGQRMGAVDDNLAEVIPMQYDSIVAVEIGFLLEPDYVLIVREGGKWGLLSSGLKPVVPAKYEAIRPLMGYTYAVKQDGKFGIIDSKGEELTAFTYDSIYSGGLNHAIIVDKKKLGLLSMQGKVVAEPIYESFSDVSLYGCRCARKNGKFGVISSGGEELSGFIYDEFRPYASVHDQMQLKKNGKWGFFDCKSKKEITPFIYDDVTAFFGYEANVLINGKLSMVKLD